MRRRLQHPLGRPASGPYDDWNWQTSDESQVCQKWGTIRAIRGEFHTTDIPAEESNVVERIRVVVAGTEEIAMFGRRSALRTPTANC